MPEKVKITLKELQDIYDIEEDSSIIPVKEDNKELREEVKKNADFEEYTELVDKELEDGSKE